ncbi:DHA2 family efflux MFS transporter permease subunit [Pigmentiphaga soli]|uniref:DHA2 family efflux MFS transporter permease subunit n=1 Tax=Pigmentiphaga soli TaxID=1007095 RepID=A0ABP8GMK8_9BURK
MAAIVKSSQPNGLKARLAPMIIPLIVGCALFMQMLDSTVIATALPAMARSFGQDPVKLNVAITSYLLSTAVFVPICGWAADRYGARRVFASAIFLFTLSSALCGISVTLGQLVAGRFLQGFAGAMMVPVGRIVLLRSTQKSELVRAMSFLSMPALMAPIFGPALGGLIVTYGSWRWIFFMNIPIGVLGVLLVLRYIHDTDSDPAQPLDVIGFLLSGLCMAALVFGFEVAGRDVVSAPVQVALLAGGLACGVLYVWHARRAASPILDLSLFKVRTFSIAVLGGNLNRMIIGSVPFLLAMQLQVVFGLSPVAAGMLTFVGALGALMMKFSAGRTIQALGFRRTLIYNAMMTALSILACVVFTPSTPHIVILTVLLLGGFFRSLQMTAVNTLVYADVGPGQMGQATAVASTAQQLAISVGVAVAAFTMKMSMLVDGATVLASRHVVPAYVVIALLALSSVLCFMRLSPTDGAEVSGNKRH